MYKRFSEIPALLSARTAMSLHLLFPNQKPVSGAKVISVLPS